MSKYSESIPADIEGAIGWLLKHVRPGTSFLDVGCSTGYFGNFIKTHKNIQVDGVEISEDVVEARKKLDEVFSFDVDAQWPSLKKKYDYIYFGDVLEHLKDPSAALVQAKKALKDKGVIFVSIPNIAHVSIRLELLRGSFRYEPTGILDNTHLQYFTKTTFIETAAKAGFAAELVDYTENDMPKEMIQKYLDDAGLKATPKFWTSTEAIEARAYQFKFMLHVTSSPMPEASGKPDALDKPLRFRDDYINDFQKQLDQIHTHADEQAVIMEALAKENESLKAQKQELTSKVERQRELLNTTLRGMAQKQASRLKRGIKGLIK